MAAKKIKDVVVKTGEYTDRNTGQKKGRFQNVGALMKNDDGSVFILLNRWFNPAGIPSDRDTVLLSCFDLQQQDGGDQRQQQSSTADDEIPF